VNGLPSLSLRNRALIALVTLAIGFFGYVSMSSLKQELLPELELPVVSVTATYPGASPEIVDRDVARPIEAAMQGLEGLSSTRTTSNANFASVLIEFEYGTDIVYGEQRIAQALNRVQNQLPDDVDTSIFSGSIADFPVIQLAVTGGSGIEDTLREETVRDIEKIDGIREARLSGVPEQRIAITPDQAALGANGLTVQDMQDALEGSGVLIPAGQITDDGKTLTVQAGSLIRSVDEVKNIALFSSSSPQPVTLDDLADVRLENKPRSSISRVNGEAAYTISITKTPAANTVDVSHAIRDAMPELERALNGAKVEVVFDQAPFIEQSIETLLTEGLLGLVFAVLVIFLFLRSFAATIVTAISIPASLLATFIALQFAGYTLNILTLGAITIAIGRVVDDSIVVIENIRRHLGAGEARGAQRAKIILRAVGEVAGAITASTIATVAVFLPLAFVGDVAGELFRPFGLTTAIALLASLLVSLTIVPVLAYWFLSGTKKRKTNGGDASAVEATAETVSPSEAEAVRARSVGQAGGGEHVAHTPLLLEGSSVVNREAYAPAELTPAQRRLLAKDPAKLSRGERRRRERLLQQRSRLVPEREAMAVEPQSVSANTAASNDSRDAHGEALSEVNDERPTGWLQRAYEPVLRWTIGKPAVTLSLALLLLIGTFALVPMLKTNFLGDTGQDTLSVSQDLPLDADLDRVDEMAKPVEEAIINNPNVKTLQTTYTANSMFASFSGASGNTVRHSITLNEGADTTAVEQELRDALDALTDVGDVSVSAGGGGAGGGMSQDVEIDVTAANDEDLRAATDAITEKLSARDDILEAKSSLSETRPFVRVDVNRTEAAKLGLNERAIGGIVAQRIANVPSGEVIIDGATVGVEFVPNDPPSTLGEIRDIPLPGPTGPVTLSSVADVEIVDGPAQINSDRGSRVATITVTPASDDLRASNQAIDEVLAEVDMPGSARADLGGVSANQAEAFRQLGLALLAAILIVYIIMVATFRSLLQPLLLLISIPFAATGAIALLLIADSPVGVATLVGALMLVGVVVTNAIVLIDLVNQFRERGLSVREAVVEGGVRRVRPIVMTALATILALVPMGTGLTGGDGGFISQALALVVIGGLLSSTILTLIVLPALYTAVEGPLERRRIRRDERLEAEARENRRADALSRQASLA